MSAIVDIDPPVISTDATWHTLGPLGGVH